MKRAFIIIIIVLALAGAGFAVAELTGEDSYVRRAEASPVRNEGWNAVYAGYVNQRGISLLIDEDGIAGGDRAYLNDSAGLMLERELLRDYFECSVNLYENSLLRIARGGRYLQMTVGEKELTVYEDLSSGNVSRTIELAEPACFREEELFIPAEVLTLGLGYSYEWQPNTQTAIFTSSSQAVDSMPYYCSYADTDIINYVRNQGDLGACWAFAAAAALEYSLQPEEAWDFSEDHMLMNNVYQLDDFGGDYLIALSYLTAWKGPVNEADDPYNDGMTDPDLTAVKHVQNVQFLNERNDMEIKKLIFRYGVVESSLYIELNENNTSLSTENYDPDTYSYLYIGDNDPNHEIVIIGWDDDYPKERFGGRADRNGAFICKNSWGSEFGDNGKFYVSYCDSVIGSLAVAYTGIEDPDNYDNIYQQDDAGWVGVIGYGRNKAYMANVYTAESDESLRAVGFYATGPDTSYKVYVCPDYKGPASLDITGRVYAQGTFRNAGYYTVDLTEPVSIASGSRFACIVEIDTPSSSKPVAIEISTQNVEVDCEGKESYLSNYGEQWECLQQNNSGNICLKAFTDAR